MLNMTQLLSGTYPMLHATSQLDAIWWDDPTLTNYSQDILRLLSQKVGVSVIRDTTSITLVQGQATYNAPVDFLDTIHIYLNGLILRPASTQQLERLDPNYQITQASSNNPIKYWYADKIGPNKIGTYPVSDASNAGFTLEIIFHAFLGCTLTPTSQIVTPVAIQDFLQFALLGRAYNDESDSRMLDVSAVSIRLANIYEHLLDVYYGDAQ